MRRAKVFNLCRSYGYQTLGYYVSLLAAARGHRPLPSVATIQDLRSTPLLRVVSEDLQDEVQRAWRRSRPTSFSSASTSAATWPSATTGSARRCSTTSRRRSCAPSSPRDGPLAARQRCARSPPARSRTRTATSSSSARGATSPGPVDGRDEQSRYDLAILVNPEEVDAPSDERRHPPVRQGGASASACGADVIGRGRLRPPRRVRRAVHPRDDRRQPPHLPLRPPGGGGGPGRDRRSRRRSSAAPTRSTWPSCFERHGMPDARAPSSSTATTPTRSATQLGFPCVLKQPDSSFSQGVVKVDDAAELERAAGRRASRSPSWWSRRSSLPTDFDWRIGVLDGEPLYACQYYMARGHWQISNAHGERRRALRQGRDAAGRGGARRAR